MLDAHFIAGDGRVNENIGLTAIHQVFHSEHDRLVDDIKNVLTDRHLRQRRRGAGRVEARPSGADGWNGERLFQAARFVTEMEYQHLVFEEFARKVQPAIKPFERATTRRHQPGDPRPSSPTPSTASATRCSTRRSPARTRTAVGQLDIPLLDGVPQPAGVLQRRHRRHADPRAGGGQHHHGHVGPGRQRARRVRHRDAAQQPAGPAPGPAGAST